MVLALAVAVVLSSGASVALHHSSDGLCNISIGSCVIIVIQSDGAIDDFAYAAF